MIFHKPQKHVASISLKIEHTVIQKVKDFNFLVFIVNEHLNWKTHKATVSNSISKTIGLLNRLNIFFQLK